MKKLVKRYILAILPICIAANLHIAHAQTGLITTIAGTGTPGHAGDYGAASAAELNLPGAITTDPAGNIYIADYGSNYVRKIDPSGIITTFAGNGAYGFSGDGLPATAVEVARPSNFAIDGAGNVYIVSAEVVRMVDPAGIISTAAGVAGSTSYNGDGHPAFSATTFTPGFHMNLAIDGTGNIYVSSEGDNRVVRFNPASGGIVTTVAGTGIGGSGPDGVSATTSMLNAPRGIVVDGSGNLLISDAANYRIRKVSPAGIITTIAGTGTIGAAGDEGPAISAQVVSIQLCLDNRGNLYSIEGNSIRRIDAAGIIHAYAGIFASPGFSGDNGPATNAKLYDPVGIAWYNQNLYIADYTNSRVRKVHGIDYNAPDFPAGDFITTSLCADGSTLDVSSLLAIRDADTGFSETWSLLVPPTHGAAVAAYTAVSTGGTLTPSGITYTPAYGYTGSDSFKVSICDEIMYDTITVRVTVNPYSFCHVAVNSVNNAEVKVFPNPSRGELYITDLLQLTTYRLINVTGICVLHGSLQQGSNTVSLQGIPVGIYTLELNGADGERKIVRVMKE